MRYAWCLQINGALCFGQLHVGMPCMQCKVLYVGKYSNPSFGPFHKFFVPYRVFFLAYAFGMWHI